LHDLGQVPVGQILHGPADRHPAGRLKGAHSASISIRAPRRPTPDTTKRPPSRRSLADCTQEHRRRLSDATTSYAREYSRGRSYMPTGPGENRCEPCESGRYTWTQSTDPAITGELPEEQATGPSRTGRARPVIAA